MYGYMYLLCTLVQYCTVLQYCIVSLFSYFVCVAAWAEFTLQILDRLCRELSKFAFGYKMHHIRNFISLLNLK